MDCDTAAVADVWSHHTQDGGGLTFEFFRQPPAQEPGVQWHCTFAAAIALLQQQLAA
ncbi:MAG: hypothetical protein AAF404_07225 [Pseudomonadota bacterium]